MTVTDFATYLGLSRVLKVHAGIRPEISIKISQAHGQGKADRWFLMQGDNDFWQVSHKKQKPVRRLKIAA